MIEREKLPYRQHSILAAGARLGIPVTVHVALGTDIIHMHPDASGEAIGKGSLTDFHTFASAVAGLSGGVYFNIGSAVILPEVFLKAISLARNVGASVEGFTTVNMDFIRHYRPQTNVVGRPTAGTGRGITLVGHHEIMVPLVCAGIIDALDAALRPGPNKHREDGRRDDPKITPGKGEAGHVCTGAWLVIASVILRWRSGIHGPRTP